MKVISQTYKDNIKQIGREITYQITYTNNGTTTTLGDEDILNANLHYDGGMLKSVMKQLDIELYNDLAIGTTLDYKFGTKINDSPNIFDLDRFITENKNATIIGTPNNFTYEYKGVTSYINYNFKDQTYYKLSGTWETTYGNGRVRIAYTDGTYQTIFENYSMASASGTINVTSYLKQIKNIEIITWTTGNFTFKNFQIEEGQTATTYQPYPYEKINYGNFIVYSSEKLEDSNTYKLVCYDKMLYAMKDYEKIESQNYSNGVNQNVYLNQAVNQCGIASSNSGLYIAVNGGNYIISTTTTQTRYRVACSNSIPPTTGTATAYNGQNKDETNDTITIDTTGYAYLIVNATDLSSIKIQKYRVEYPITIREYINQLSRCLGLTFANATDTFPNYDKIIENELYLDTDGNSLNYTFRDILGELAQATGSTICINDNDELELRYINDTGTTTEIEGTSLNFTTQGIRPQSEVKLEAQTLSQDSTPTPTSPQAIHTITGENEIKVVGKNLLNPTGISYSQNGITFTNNGDGTFTANGTATANTTFSLTNLTTTPIRLEANKPYTQTLYVLSGTWAGSVVPAFKNGSGTITYNYFNNTGASPYQTKTPTEDMTCHTYYFYMPNGATATNCTFRVQLERGTIENATYEPYKEMSNKINLGKNLLNNQLTTQTLNNVEFIVNDDKSITIKGTATARTEPRLWQKSSSDILILEKGITYYNNMDRVLYLYAGGYITINANSSYTPTDNKNVQYIYIRVENAEEIDTTIYPMLSRMASTTYAPYFTPIELCKIGNYEDGFIKTTGKNLFDASKITNTNIIVNTDGQKFTMPIATSGNGYVDTNTKLKDLCPTLKVGDIVYLKFDKTPADYNKYIYLSVSDALWNKDASRTISQNDLDSHVCLYGNKYNSGQTEQVIITNFRIVKNENDTFEPYGTNEWWLKKNIEKAILTSANRSGGGTTGTNAYYLSTNLTTLNDNTIALAYSNMFKPSSFNARANGLDIVYSQNGGLTLRTANNTSINWADNTNRDNWLNTNTPIVYYVLATPTYTKLTNTDLIKQLESIQKMKLYNGINNIVQSNSDLPITLKFSYTNTLDTIDEEYFKDINVNFGEYTKPINTITFKRSGDSDSISLSYPEDLADEDKNEIAISDNQILAYDNRDEYLQDILDQLYGLSYALNDYTSTGITWLDLCDRYNVLITKTDDEGNTIESNVYTCVMFNDEINVNQGLQETIHTDRPEESTTDYNTTTKSDRLEKRTSLVVNKQEGYIEAITGELGMVDGQSQVIQGIRSKQTDTEAVINVITSFDENGNPTGVRTEKGFTFDKNGLNITSSSNEYKTKIDETGTFYYDGDTELGRTTKDGSAFRDMELYGEFYYGKDEYDETSLFVSMLYNDGTEECFGHFYNGREVE